MKKHINREPTNTMYKTGLQYLKTKSTNWCVNDLFSAMWDAAASSDHCQCDACKNGIVHDSDCAVHNMPAMPNGPCDCARERP